MGDDHQMRNNKKLIAALGAAGVLAASASAFAEEPKFGSSVTLTGVSDYIFRGISMTDEKPAVQANAELTYGIAYLGIFGSNIGDGDLAAAGYQVTGPWEVDLSAGIRPTLGPVNFDLGVLWYLYGARSNPVNLSKGDVDYVEFKISASVPLTKQLTVGVTGYYTPDQDFAIPETATVEGTAAYALPQVGVFSPSISGSLGYSNSWESDIFTAGAGPFIGDDSYAYWNAGLKLTAEKFFLDFRYWDTNIESPAAYSEYEKLGDSRFVFSAGVNLLP